jgi:hypothetical protein
MERHYTIGGDIERQSSMEQERHHTAPGEIERQSSMERHYTVPGSVPGSPTSIPRQSSLQRAMADLDTQSNGSSSEGETSSRSKKPSRSKMAYGSSKPKSYHRSKKAYGSSNSKEMDTMKAENFLEQYDNQAKLRGKTRL